MSRSRYADVRLLVLVMALRPRHIRDITVAAAGRGYLSSMARLEPDSTEGVKIQPKPGGQFSRVADRIDR